MDATDFELRRRTYAYSWSKDERPQTTVAKLAELAFAWWDDRLSADWVPHTREQNSAILERLGLVDRFWELS